MLRTNLAILGWLAVVLTMVNQSVPADEPPAQESPYTIRGQVVDGRGEPIPLAEVHLGAYMPMRPAVVCDDRGQFLLAGLRREPASLIAAAPTYAIEATSIDPAIKQPLTFVLTRSRRLCIRVEDPQGRALEGVVIQGDDWRKTAAFVRLKTDKDGRVTWNEAPHDSIEFMIAKPGHASLLNVALLADGQEQRIVLPEELVVRGVVTDRRTGKPVKDFQWMPVNDFTSDSHITVRSEARAGQNGKFEARFDRLDVAYRLRVEAPGYAASISQAFRVGEKPRQWQFELERADPLTGRVIHPSGKPVAGAQVVLSTHSQPAKPFDAGYKDQNQTRTGQDGSFTFGAQAEDYTILAFSADGFAIATAAQKDLSHELTLQPWAQVAGKVSRDGQGVARHLVTLESTAVAKGKPSPIEMDQRLLTDDSGRFAFSQVLPGEYRLQGDISLWRAGPLQSSESVPLVVEAGSKHEQLLGSGTARLTARVGMIDQSGCDFSYSLNYLVALQSDQTDGSGLATKAHGLADWSPVWTNTEEGRRWLAERRHWFVKLAADGAMNVPGVTPGKYLLILQVFEPPVEGCLVVPHSVHQQLVDIPADGIALGDIKLTKMPGCRIGESFPSIPLIDTHGAKVRLSERKGKVILLDLWASWCGACLTQSPQVRALAKRFQDDDRCCILGVNADDDREVAVEAIRKHRLDWPQTFIEGDKHVQVMKETGCTTLPAYLVVDEQGILRYRGPSLDSAESILKKRLSLQAEQRD
jgi:thiol-disulfide isomerase/thioredoxin